MAKWNGTAWSALGAGANGQVNALAVVGSEMYVGGQFTQAGGGGAKYVARWDGTAWSTLGTGLNNEVKALAVGPGNNLNAGGIFTTVGDGSTVTAYFGIYNASVVTSTSKPVPSGRAGFTLAPNPAQHAVQVAGVLPKASAEVFDALGHFVTSATADATGTATLALPAGLPTGMYVVRAGNQALRLLVE